MLRLKGTLQVGCQNWVCTISLALLDVSADRPAGHVIHSGLTRTLLNALAPQEFSVAQWVEHLTGVTEVIKKERKGTLFKCLVILALQH